MLYTYGKHVTAVRAVTKDNNYLDVLGQKGRRNLFQLIAWKTKCLTFCFGSVTEHDMLRPIRRGRQLIYKIISLILVKKLNLITDKIQPV